MEQIFEIGGAAERMKKRVLGYARKLGWNNAAVAFHGDRVARCAKCQAPDMARYMADFRARRAER